MLLALQVTFFVLLIGAQVVPNRPIVSNLVTAVEDETYGPTGRPDMMGGIAATHSECVMVGTGLGRPDMGLFERAVRMPRISSCVDGAEDLRRLERGEPVEDGHVTDYFRYWAGYTVLTRPVLALSGLEGIRIVSGALLVLAGAAAMVVVTRQTTKAFAAGLALPLLLGSNVMSTPSSAFGFSLSYAAVLFGLVLTAQGARHSLERAVLGTVVSAAIFNYFTQLTTPAIPWMMSAAVAGAIVFRRSNDIRRTLVAVGSVGVAWPVAFGVTWASRWALAAVFVGWDEAVEGVKDKIDFRLAGGSDAVDLSLGVTTNENVRYWLDDVPTSWAVLAAATIATIVALIVSYWRFGAHRLVLFSVLSAPAVIAPLWYEALRNHSQIHTGFTYANVPATLGVVLGAALFAATSPRGQRLISHHRDEPWVHEDVDAAATGPDAALVTASSRTE